ncbi:hypothetical protein [Mesorhizobium sp. Z1-4]|uniref:hypothetical protein n=1 Tax=Mesorhizobium sp. Z1-4 TaxID=2448478 RepID=UPI000FDC0277|nr:hypothetical protein [Mesorhizobium sp. Z1-4]
MSDAIRGWRSMHGAPKDNTMVLLLVQPIEGEGWTPFADSMDPYVTIGFNGRDDTGTDCWQFAGWDWSHDCFVDGQGKVLAWMPLPVGWQA